MQERLNLVPFNSDFWSPIFEVSHSVHVVPIPGIVKVSVPLTLTIPSRSVPCQTGTLGPGDVFPSQGSCSVNVGSQSVSDLASGRRTADGHAHLKPQNNNLNADLRTTCAPRW